jgi:small subunit ribosomal protein S21
LPKVNVGKDEPIDRAIRRFKKLCIKESLFKETKRRQYYIKPSQRRRQKSAKAQRNG